MARRAFSFSLHCLRVQQERTQRDVHSHKSSKQGWHLFEWNTYVYTQAHTNRLQRECEMFPCSEICSNHPTYVVLPSDWCQLAIWLHFHHEHTLESLPMLGKTRLCLPECWRIFPHWRHWPVDVGTPSCMYKHTERLKHGSFLAGPHHRSFQYCFLKQTWHNEEILHDKWAQPLWRCILPLHPIR